MFFYQSSSRNAHPETSAAYPCITFYKDNWNDFGYTTLFHLKLWIRADEAIELGSVKILQLNETGEVARSTQLPSSFDRLPESFCSLGQGKEYYELLLENEYADEVLPKLQDIAYNRDQSDAFEESPAFKDSLLRFSEAVHNYKNAAKLLGRIPPPVRDLENLAFQQQFTFRFRFDGFSSPHEVTCDFREHDHLPYRITAFVGKNGTGKTAVLAEMAKHLSGTEPARASGEGGFLTGKPYFSRIVAVSYSPFGPFKYPAVTTSSYRYCGLLSSGARLNSSILEKRIKRGMQDIGAQERHTDWIEALTTAGLFENEPLMGAMHSFTKPDDILDLWRNMSSGHFYTALLLTDVVANLMEDSLLLLDEPELYLHPNMLSGLMRSLDQLLRTFRSFAIVATHSPIVVQEIPGRSVRVFSRISDEPHCSTLEFESFGEALTNIVNQVFGQTREDKNYMQILERLSEGRSADEVDALFGGKLSLNARAFVSALAEKWEERRS